MQVPKAHVSPNIAVEEISFMCVCVARVAVSLRNFRLNDIGHKRTGKQLQFAARTVLQSHF